MIILMISIWSEVGGGLLSEVGNIFSSGERSGGFEGLGSFGAFLAGIFYYGRIFRSCSN
jgi:NCS1 family nucleobase:cation symporter-1